MAEDFHLESGAAAPAKSILCCNTVHKKHLEKLRKLLNEASKNLPVWNEITEAERKAKKSSLDKTKKFTVIEGFRMPQIAPVFKCIIKAKRQLSASFMSFR